MVEGCVHVTAHMRQDSANRMERFIKEMPGALSA